MERKCGYCFVSAILPLYCLGKQENVLNCPNNNRVDYSYMASVIGVLDRGKGLIYQIEIPNFAECKRSVLCG